MNFKQFRRSALVCALAGSTLLLAACENHDDNGSSSNPSNQTISLSALIKSLFATFTYDTSLPTEIDNLKIDSSSEDPNDPNFAAILGN